jgi:hypothetical protein
MQRALIVVFALLLAVPAARADSTYRYEDVERVVAVADLHDHHQVMNIAGDLRYVSDAEYAAFAGRLAALDRETL